MTDDDLLRRVRRRLAADPAEVTPAGIAAAVRAECGGRPIDGGVAVLERLQDDLLGAGPLAPLLRDASVTDVLVNAPDEVWVDRGAGLERVPATFADDAAVRSLVNRLLLPSGRRLDAAAPWVDARLPDGTRLHAVLAPVATRGTCVSLRTLARQRFTLDDLAARRSVTPGVAEVLRAAVQARLALLVSGGTGTGKTTTLACLLGLVPPGERVVVVEDAAELRPGCPHLVTLEARPPNVDGAGEITMRDLVRQAMRMRPDRLVVGEVRGAEVVEMLAALNTGHEGGMSTVHANTAAAVPTRLEALGATAGLHRLALHAQFAAALDLVVHLRREADGIRRVAELAVVERSPDGTVRVEPALVATPDGEEQRRVGWPRLARLLADRGESVAGTAA
ncbi:MAG TPA: TadA family conjugal transfer-associated ATPase [Mycobacteriales bacterium]|nr:TadA family conjugal transfer-associated ATPase [Mycobacteriales bacterium]